LSSYQFEENEEKYQKVSLARTWTRLVKGGMFGDWCKKGGFWGREKWETEYKPSELGSGHSGRLATIIIVP